MKQPDSPDFDQHISSYKEDFTPDLSGGLQRLHASIGITDVKPPQEAPVRLLSRRSWFSAAAAILLLFTVGYLALSGDGNTVIFNETDAPLATTLPDGTQVLLQQGAELIYGEAFNDTDRQVSLDGQAFFQVYKDPNRPFLVSTSETELRVTGTAFNLRVDGEELEVEVSEGAVQLSREDQVMEVKAKHCGLALPGRKCSLMLAENLNRHAWRTGTLRFQGAPLAAVVKTVANNYGYTVNVPKDCDFPVSGTFSAEDPVSILRTLAELGGGELQVRNAEKNVFAFIGICEG